jgi:hypothetical protein
MRVVHCASRHCLLPVPRSPPRYVLPSSAVLAVDALPLPQPCDAVVSLSWERGYAHAAHRWVNGTQRHRVHERAAA